MRGGSRLLGAAAAPILAVSAGLGVLALGLLLGGYDPVSGLLALWDGAFGSWYAIASGTLNRSVPLIVIGLGFAFGQRGGGLNIGAEGQFYAGAIAATWVGLHLGSWPGLLAVPTLWIAALGAGALWMALPVWLRLRFGVLEVISTLLLNAIAESMVSLMVSGPLQEHQHIYPQSDPIAASAQLPMLPGTRLHLGFLVAIAASAALAFVLSRTVWGFRLRAAGAGPRAAFVSGRIDTRRMLAVALLGSGALAGLAGGIEVGGVSYALYPNLSPGYGFTGIAVALLARGNPLAIVGTGIFFGALESGAGAMQRDAGIPSVIVYVAEAVAIVTVLLADRAARRVAERISAAEGVPA